MKEIALNGPMAKYEAKSRLNIPIGSAYRLFKNLEEDGLIVEYRREPHPSGHEKILYGLTRLGFCHFVEITIAETLPDPLPKDIKNIEDLISRCKPWDQILDKYLDDLVGIWANEKIFVERYVPWIRDVPNYLEDAEIRSSLKILLFGMALELRLGYSIELEPDIEYFVGEENLFSIQQFVGGLLSGMVLGDKYQESLRTLCQKIPSCRATFIPFFKKMISTMTEFLEYVSS